MWTVLLPTVSAFKSSPVHCLQPQPWGKWCKPENGITIAILKCNVKQLACDRWAYWSITLLDKVTQKWVLTGVMPKTNSSKHPWMQYSHSMNPLFQQLSHFSWQLQPSCGWKDLGPVQPQIVSNCRQIVGQIIYILTICGCHFSHLQWVLRFWPSELKRQYISKRDDFPC